MVQSAVEENKEQEKAVPQNFGVHSHLLSLRIVALQQLLSERNSGAALTSLFRRKHSRFARLERKSWELRVWGSVPMAVLGWACTAETWLRGDGRLYFRKRLAQLSRGILRGN